jgi:hypothetical protein
MNPDIKTIIDFVREQMDGGQVPPAGSSEFNAMGQAVGNLIRHNSPRELEILAHEVLGVVIDRVRSNLAAEKALRAFIQPGGNHD